MSDTSLLFTVLGRDRLSSTLGKIRKNALSTSGIIKAALGPGLLPALAASTGAVAGLGAALAGAGAALGVFGAVAKSAFTEVKEASDKSQDLRDKIELLERQARVANATGIGDAGAYEAKKTKAINELLARYSLLPPATRKVVVAYDGMKASWKRFVDANKPAVYGIMTRGFALLSQIIPKLQPLFNAGAAAARRFVGAFEDWSGGGGVERLVAFLATTATSTLYNLGRIGRNLGVTFGKFFAGAEQQGTTFLAWAAEASGRLATFAEGGGFQRFMDLAATSGPVVGKALADIATAAVNVAKAVAPLAPVSLAIASGLASILAAIPPGVLTTLVGGWVALSVALKAYNAAMMIGLTGTRLVAAAVKVWTAMQWLLNLAMSANPIGLVVLAIAAIAAGIYLLWTHSEGFRKFWIKAWEMIKAAAVVAWNWIKSAAGTVFGWFMTIIKTYISVYVGAWNLVKNAAGAAWNWIKSKVTTVYTWLVGLPSKISSKLSTMWDGLKAGFKTAINWVISKWNAISFKIPSVSVFGQTLGGGTVGTPKLPHLDVGGHVQRDGLAMIHKGETVTPAEVTPYQRGGGDAGTVRFVFDGAEDEFVKFFRKIMRTTLNGA